MEENKAVFSAEMGYFTWYALFNVTTTIETMDLSRGDLDHSSVDKSFSSAG